MRRFQRPAGALRCYLAATLVGVLSAESSDVSTTTHRGSGNFTKYIMWIPGRGGSTWTTEMLAKSHPNILAHMEIFSGSTGLNFLGAGKSCGEDKGVGISECVEALDKYWSTPDDIVLLRNKKTKPGKVTPAPTVRIAPVVAKGFKVRPTVGWAGREMMEAYAGRDLRFVCNTRHDSLRHGLSMYRHGLSRGQSKVWKQIELLYGDGTHNNSRVFISAEVLSTGQTDLNGLRMGAECTVRAAMFTNKWGNTRQQNIWLSNCAQNITYRMFDYVHARAERLMKAVHAICFDYQTLHGGAVHWLNYEKTQRNPQGEINAMADFLTNGVDGGGASQLQTTLPAASTGSRPTPVRHKTTATHGGGLQAFLSSVPNLGEVTVDWWNRTGCKAGVISDVMLPLHLHGSGAILSTYTVTALLFDHSVMPAANARSPPGVGTEPPFVAIGTALPWLNRALALHGNVKHAVINHAAWQGLPLTPSGVQCNGNCDKTCRKSVLDFVSSWDRHGDHSNAATVPTGVSVMASTFVGWDTADRGADPVITTLAKKKVRLVCAVWANAIEGGLARLHDHRLRQRELDPDSHCQLLDSELPVECLHTLETDELRAAVNAVAMETFATLRVCRDYALAAGDESVFVVTHRSATLAVAPTEQLDVFARFLGMNPWAPAMATRIAQSSYTRFFPNLSVALRDVLHVEAHMSPDARTAERVEKVCMGCDAYSIADTIALLTPLPRDSRSDILE